MTLPLAIHGVVCKKDGTKVDIVIGEDDNDPVIGISDLLVHLAQTQQEKKANKVIEGEDLNVLVGSMPLKDEEKDAVKANILKILNDKYGIEEEDFYQQNLKLYQLVRLEIMVLIEVWLWHMVTMIEFVHILHLWQC